MPPPLPTRRQSRQNSHRHHAIQSLDKQTGAPPPYSPRSHVAPETPDIGDFDFSASPLELPTAADCVTHLMLLHAFAKLRHDVGNCEGLYGIEFERLANAKEPEVSVQSVNETPQRMHGEGSAVTPADARSMEDLGTLTERLREKRWTIFVTKAVDRFQKWWESLPSDSAYFNSAYFNSALEMDHFDSARSPSQRPLTEWPTSGDGMDEYMHRNLPPLDVLMVWHSYMLNPRVYLEDCMRMGKHRQWRTSVPWKLIYDSIDDSFEYHPPSASKDTKDILVQYTQPPTHKSLEAMKACLSDDFGYASQRFQELCPRCNLIITHEKLHVGKFINDVASLRTLKLPLPGTVLATWGVPELVVRGKTPGTHDPFFPNRVAAQLESFAPNALSNTMEKLSMKSIKDGFKRVMNSRSTIRLVNSEQHNTQNLAVGSKIAVRRMLSHYWDNSSPFGLDLVGAVIRQASFVQKMVKIDWLHSPSLFTTMQRSIVKYHRFMRIIAENFSKSAVPTLDVDLAWHTHQLTPKVYYTYTVSETRRFINHDDKIPGKALDKAFVWTSEVYEKQYGTPYTECACWYCEATREPLRSSLTNRIFSSTPALDIQKISSYKLCKNASTGPHISSHNALVIPESARQRRAELNMLDMQYAKVRKRYEKKKRGNETPTRETDACVYGPYGYPMYYPAYYPVGVPYYADPSCEHSGGDRTTGGGCIAGTCAEGASVGNCANPSNKPACRSSCGGTGGSNVCIYSVGCEGCSSGGGNGGGGCGGGGDSGGGGCGGGGGE
ncbi:hypothetical protein BU23DRAFT_524073 [Bimuria novae-zelandiae CBS 107.79]|uniref:Glycine-rich domain-containing protein n=1 Tax=Bimuria novae-zelandiae CBS 107.79 TaxID=1447943 RepID=A0A6A5VS21_9PLEO|nr:hypothetical protein BU23DRAFT_524073 [Bimuria novae-zelandiae CBS 107.79]